MFIYEGCAPFNGNQEAGQYRWHFEDPKKPDHKVIEEMVIDYGNDKVIVVKCESENLNYSAILGVYDDSNNTITAFRESSPRREAIAKEIANIAGLDGLVDI